MKMDEYDDDFQYIPPKNPQYEDYEQDCPPK